MKLQFCISGRIGIVLFLLLLSGASRMLAQSEKGALTGKVLDSSGAVLQGAEISLEPAGAHAVSDAQGQFFVNDLPPGHCTITVTYVGFTAFTKEIDVKPGQPTAVEARMQLSSVSTQVLVTAERAAGEAEAINRERSADNIVQVLPSDVIRSLPNANMADALGRLPSVTLERDEGEGKYVQIRGTEPRLTNTTIDGINVPSPESGVRQIKFDAIPADLVESVEINKTLQANMDGDGIGGSVNLVTKTATERPTVAVSGMGGYMPILGGRSQVESTGTIGQRFGSSKKFGILVGASYDWTGRGIDDIEPVSDLATLPGGSTAVWKDAIDIREYRYYRSRWGVAGSTDYTLGPGSDVYARFLYSNFKNYGDRWVYSLNDNTPDIQLLGSNGCDPAHPAAPCTGVPTFNTQDRRPNIGIGSLLLGGKHEFASSWAAWDVSGARSYLENVLPGTASFDSTLGSSNCQFDPATTKSIYRPQFTPACFTEAYDPTQMQLSDVQIDHGQSAQVNFQVSGAYAKRYHLGNRLSTIEIGGRFRNAHKYDDSYNIDYTPNDSILLSQFPNGFTNDNYYGGSYKLGYNVNYQTVRDFLMRNLDAFAAASSAGVDPANYSYVEKVSAGYLMNTIDLTSRVRIVAGVRFEGTNLSVVNRVFNGSVDPPTVSDNRFSGSYLKVLPSVSLRYALTGSTNLRLAYGRGLSRPDPQDIAQAVTFTTAGSPGNLKNLVTLGNPNLKPETADNFDVLVEQYLNPFGIISGGFFYKRLSDPIVTQTFTLTNFTPAPNLPPGTYTATQPINAGSAWIAGFEAAYLQHLSFLPGPLSGLGISANYGYTGSRANDLPGRSDHPRLLRNAPNTWNISPTYDRGRVSIRVGLSYNQANISAYAYQDGTPTQDGTPSDPTPGGLHGPFSDQYFYTHLQLDAQGSVRLAHGLSFIAYGLNLTNEVFGFYQGSTQYMIQREYYQPTYAFGFRWSPAFEHK
jgi:TonB-dependent receptor